MLSSGRRDHPRSPLAEAAPHPPTADHMALYCGDNFGVYSQPAAATAAPGASWTTRAPYGLTNYTPPPPPPPAAANPYLWLKEPGVGTSPAAAAYLGPPPPPPGAEAGPLLQPPAVAAAGTFGCAQRPYAPPAGSAAPASPAGSAAPGELASLSVASREDQMKMVRPYSYRELVAMAIQSAPERKLTLRHIYQFVADSFPYYQHCKSHWKNSIRKSLVINDCFKKVPLDEDDPRKGHYWTLDPNCAEMFDNGNFRGKRKRPSKASNNSAVTAGTSKSEGLTSGLGAGVGVIAGGWQPLFSDEAPEPPEGTKSAASSPGASVLTSTACFSAFFNSLSTLNNSSPGSTQRAIPGSHHLGIQGSQLPSSTFPPTSISDSSPDSQLQRGPEQCLHSSPFYNFSMVSSLFYPGEDSEV